MQAPMRTLREPFVGVIVVAGQEPVRTTIRTIRSVLEQDWPRDRLAVVVVDDTHRPALRDALALLPIVHHVPEPHRSPIDSALRLLRERFPHMVYVDLRDVGDEPGTERFIRRCVQQLEEDPTLSFAQASGGSGVIWRDEALEELGSFPDLRLVPA
jgi:cellulose synthase (UDP-forming)